MSYKHKCKGVCSNYVTFDIEHNQIKNVAFSSGCDGNLQGISALVEGMNTEDVIKKLKGIRCGGKNTSCPDQLATAIEQISVTEQKGLN